ncbi:alpha/beta hydrolase [Hymenobacter rigui]|uniref:Alpha/beta hydrolase n=1 Tax=Hymenobacter rigui TaxID=334424 RepID=A0A3R9MJW8_9BACT|nr:alpha/beta hydrolase [Hymenobacter rigui]RSK44021.1 alpha/beta hydrolase [Hymenobacter rigui]
MIRYWLPAKRACKPVLSALAGGLLLAAPARAQQPALPRDTSFTTYSAFVKARKQHPDISIARPPVPATIRSRVNVPYTEASSRPLLLDVFYPKARRHRPAPAVLLVHGGGWRSGHRSQHHAMAQQLAARGFVAVTAEYRLSPEAPYPAAVQDLKTALRWLRAHARPYGLDTTRVAIWGFSAGGQLAALAGTTNADPRYETGTTYRSRSSQVQAIVDVDGILAFTHPESGEGDDRKGLSAATQWLGGSREASPGLWEQASALSHIGPGTPPMLFINSGVARMHAGRDDVRRQLTALGIYSEEHTFPEAPHPFPLFNPWFAPTLEYTVQFLQRVFGRP